MFGGGAGTTAPLADELTNTYFVHSLERAFERIRSTIGWNFDETVAAKYPPQDPGGNRGARSIDGEPRRPVL
jgi:hypothetical protein